MKDNKTIRLLTPEGEALAGVTCPWNTYPRPQMRRDSFLCLNGTWEVTLGSGETRPILVPFPPESLLSEICMPPQDVVAMMYRKSFTLPEGFRRDRVLLHFGAVDQCARVFLNDRYLGQHDGGYEAFSFDITDLLQPQNTLVVEAWDCLKPHILPYGKQRVKRGGMWYTPVSGIWQTVWLESVPETYIRALRIDTADNTATITADGVTHGTVSVTTPDGPLSFPLADGQATVTIPSPRLWSPEDPYLYEFTVTAGEDRVSSYFALRTLEIKRVNEIPRLCLNGKPYFFHALLDQGYFPEGIYTPASPTCYEQDIRTAKELGFNTLRKHIKVEPEQFYYDCDRLGMVVFQDMVNNGHYSFIRDTALPTIGLKSLSDKHLHRDQATRKAFCDGMKATVRQLRNHPCICCWTIFNEGWGQFDSQKAYESLRDLDPTRFIDTASGWFKGADSDVDSEHVYFKPVKLTYGDRPMVLSEFGGYACKLRDHAFNPERTYGYRLFAEQADFEDTLIRLYEDEIIPAISKGLCAAVYTQLTDVEDETNGLITYDRRVVKVNAERMRRIAERLAEEMDPS